MSSARVLLMLVASAGLVRTAQARQAPPVQDNSFLVEEAYNQEAGVVQHILLLQRPRHGAGWMLGFTQEWPFGGQRHQLGFTLPLTGVDAAGRGGASGVGDLLINYRHQLLGGEGAGLWLAPRASLVLPTGDWRSGRGDGGVGWQLAVPASVLLAPTVAAHMNATLSLNREARNAAGARAALVGFAGAASLIWLPRPAFNLLAELVVEDGAEVAGPGTVHRRTTVFLAPGVRWAHNLRGGVQVVPGIGYALGLGDAADDSALLLYLSVEHRFKH